MRIFDSCKNWRRNSVNPNPENQDINLYATDGQNPNNYVQQVHREHFASDNDINQLNEANQNLARVSIHFGFILDIYRSDPKVRHLSLFSVFPSSQASVPTLRPLPRSGQILVQKCTSLERISLKHVLFLFSEIQFWTILVLLPKDYIQHLQEKRPKDLTNFRARWKASKIKEF